MSGGHVKLCTDQRFKQRAPICCVNQSHNGNRMIQESQSQRVDLCASKPPLPEKEIVIVLSICVHFSARVSGGNERTRGLIATPHTCQLGESLLLMQLKSTNNFYEPKLCSINSLHQHPVWSGLFRVTQLRVIALLTPQRLRVYTSCCGAPPALEARHMRIRQRLLKASRSRGNRWRLAARIPRCKASLAKHLSPGVVPRCPQPQPLQDPSTLRCIAVPTGARPAASLPLCWESFSSLRLLR